MEILNLEVLSPKAKPILLNLVDLNLINIKSEPSLGQRLAQLRRNEAIVPSLEEITKEVETVRSQRYARKMQNNH